MPPTAFVPAFAKAWSMTLVNGLLFTTTSQNCNGVRSGVYAMDLNNADRKVSYFEAGTNGAGIWGRGGAAITSGGNLKARYVIHAASMQLGGLTSAQSLRSSTAHALRIAAQKELKTIAFPAVGTGIAGFPMRECAEIMLREAAKHLEGPTSLQKIYFVLFDQEALAAFNSVRSELESKV